MLRIRQLLRLSCALLLATASAAQAQVVISQVYGGGGNTGAPFNRDFIELFNSGGTAVAIGGWSVHYASTTGNFTTNKTDIPAGITLQPGQYYLVGGGSGATGAALPTVDVSGAINLSGTAGKVALTNTNAQLGVSCPSGGALVDFVGFGAAANCSETAPTANLSNTTAAIRANAGCTDTGSNVADFALATPTPRNSGSPLNPCGGGGSPALSIGDVTLAEGDAGTSTATFTISLNFPASAGGVSFDIATSDGSATTADGDYVANAALAQTIAEGSASATFTVTINGDTQVEATEAFAVTVTNVVGATVADGVASGTLQNDDFIIVPVHAIQGNGDVSPYAVNSIVATEGIVTARTSNGFFMQTPDAEADMDAGSSEGVFVFTSAAPPASAAVGNRVRVNATLDEYNPGGQLPLTELKNATVIQVSTGNPLPAPIVLTDADANATSPVDQLERYEGMRVSIPSLRVTAPVEGNISEAAATSTSNGIFYGVLPTVGRPFREPGIDVLDPVTIPGGLTPPLFDHNPENIRVRSTGQVGATLLSVDVGDTVNNLVGVLDYGFGSYTMTPDPGAGASVVLGSVVTAVPARAADEITIGGFNLLRFFDDVADGNGATKLTTAAYQFRLKKTANAICAFTRNPDILGVVEVEHIKALSELATSINSNQGNLLFPDACTGNPGYQAYLVEGNDVGGIDVGFLLKTEEVAPGKPRVEVLSIDQVGKDTLFTNADNSTELLNDRPPLVLVARINAANGASQTVTVIANHLRSLIDVNSTATGTRGWPTVGDRVRAKRGTQALFLAQLIQDRQTANPTEKIVLLGDFNAFEFNDGFVDSMGVITGRETAATEVLRYVDSPITTPLTNTAELAAPAERYSFSFDGNAQSLDHMVVNQAVLDNFAGVRAEHSRINADFGTDNYGDATVPVRVSDHDPVVLYLREASFRTADLAADVVISSGSVSPGEDFVFSVSVANNGADDAEDAKLTLSILAPPAQVAVVAPPSWLCGVPIDDAGASLVNCTLNVFASASGGVFTVTVDGGTPPLSGSVTLGAAIAAGASDPVPANNSDSASISLSALASVSADISTTPGLVPYGNAAVFNASIGNAGPSVADNVTLVLLLDRGVPDVGVVAASGWTCGAPVVESDVTRVTCLRATMPVTSGNFVISVPAGYLATGRSVALTTSISTDTNDDATDNNDTVALQPEPANDLSVAVAAPKSLSRNVAATFRVLVANAGPSASAAAGSSALRLHVGFSGSPGAVAGLGDVGWSCASKAPLAGERSAWECRPNAGLASGGEREFTLTVVPRFTDGGDAFTVTASIASGLTEIAPGDNAASATRTVPGYSTYPPPPPRLD